MLGTGGQVPSSNQGLEARIGAIGIEGFVPPEADGRELEGVEHRRLVARHRVVSRQMPARSGPDRPRLLRPLVTAAVITSQVVDRRQRRGDLA